MSARRAPKRNLSKGILEMKFMKKSKEKVEKEKEYEESRELFGKDVSRRLKNGSEFIIEPSMVPIDDLLCGRMSFKGMNPEIERLMELEQLEARETEKALERLKSNLPDISDEEMAHRLSATVRDKFRPKRTKISKSVDSDNDSDCPIPGHDEEESAEATNEDNGSTRPKKLKFIKPVDTD